MKFTENKNLKEFNTFNISSIAKLYIQLINKNELSTLVETKEFKENKILFIGGGSNILLPDYFDGLVIHLNTKGIQIQEEPDHFIVKVQSGENWHEFIKYCIKNNLYGFENLALIPGNVGTAPIQNIGAYGVEQKDCFHSCEVFDITFNKFYDLSSEECKFSYRDSIFKNELKNKAVITEVSYKFNKIPNYNLTYFELNEYFKDKEVNSKAIFDFVVETRNRKLPNPKVLGNCGSFFKNPIINKSHLEDLKHSYPEIRSFDYDNNHVKISAAWLIEKVGLKGYRDGDAGVSPNHALILVNYGQASSKDIFDLSTKIIKKVKSIFNIELEREVNIL